MDHTTQWAQGIGLMRKPMEEELLPSSFIPTTTTTTAAARAAPTIPQQPAERKARPQKEQALHCPRCNSTNTKFCYYNNYSLTQPRYFCKACRRYWTEGGSLRNVPVGGGSRKNKRHSSSNPPSNSNIPTPSSSIKNLNPPPPPPPQISSSSNQQFDQIHDLNLAFPNHNNFLNLDNGNNMSNGGGTGGFSAMELLRSSGITARGLGPLVPMQMSMPMPSESMFPYDGVVGAGSSMQEGGRRLLFPFGDVMKQEQQQHRGQGGAGEPPMFWNGMMGGGGNGSSW